MTFNARHENDRIKFVDDLKEAIIEVFYLFKLVYII